MPRSSVPRAAAWWPLVLFLGPGCLVNEDLYHERLDALTDDDGDGYTPDQGDCNDANPEVYPGAPEQCNGLDDDCDGQADNGATGPTWFLDSDGDGYGDEAISVTACDQPAGFLSQAGDCNDDDASVHPGAPEECDGVDQDCDGEVDEGASGTQDWVPDVDGDGHGDPTAVSVASCSAPGPSWTTVADDCDDEDPQVYPGADERCNGVDDDCDGSVDEEPTVDPPTWYLDDDGDGWGQDAATLVQCAEPGGYVLVGGDCDDALPSRHPGADELCNGLDDDCDETVDEAPTEGDGTWYQDADGDGWGLESAALVACDPPDDYVAYAGDCDDTDATVHPGAEEVCNDGVDNDCDATATDPGIGEECHWDATLELMDQIVIEGIDSNEGFGHGMAYGDLDGDGVTELLLGASGGYDSESGLDLGAVSSFESPITSGGTRVDGDWVLVGEDEITGFGRKLAVGDLDGDGQDDLVVGSYGFDVDGVHNTGRSYVIYGPVTTGGAVTDQVDWVLSGRVEDGDFGRSVRTVGDLDGDGAVDFMAGGEPWLDEYDGSGLYYLVTGAGSGSEDVDDAATAVFTPDEDEGLGQDFAGVDFDRDGVGDLLLGAFKSSRGGSYRGGAYIFFGGSLEGEINTDDYDLFWYGADSGSWAGRSVDNLGDVNGDGTDDIIIGQTFDEDGSAEIIWGGSDVVGGPLADADVTFRGTVGATTGDVRYLGYLTRAMGDLNGDGEGDVLIGEYGDAPNDCHLFYGPFSAGGVIYDTDADVVLSPDSADDDGAYDNAMAPGDVTGDGVPDMVIGSQYHTAGYDEYAGAVYIVPGLGL